MYIEECKAGSFIGVDFGIYQDLSNDLPEHWQDFNEKFRPIWLENNEGKTKVAAGLACSTLHTVCKGIQELDHCLNKSPASLNHRNSSFHTETKFYLSSR